jgi:hypothetical protein
VYPSFVQSRDGAEHLGGTHRQRERKRERERKRKKRKRVTHWIH